MASSLVLKKLVSSNLVPNLRLIRPTATVPSVSRFFNTNAVREFDDGEDERFIDVDRRFGSGLSRRRDDLFLGVSGEETLVIKGECLKEFEDDEQSGRRYSSRIDLPEKIYNTSQIKAEMKNGVLKVIMPKVKEEESRCGRS